MTSCLHIMSLRIHSDTNMTCASSNSQEAAQGRSLQSMTAWLGNVTRNGGEQAASPRACCPFCVTLSISTAPICLSQKYVFPRGPGPSLIPFYFSLHMGTGKQTDGCFVMRPRSHRNFDVNISRENIRQCFIFSVAVRVCSRSS